ncbi:hypothetical protein GGR54DRAFT_643121 [Hypoxylon sp. NC1633]|nr:hypothetical protein GGR54DRAFT_643121 [Hypoxylon sp. NC1633]
MGRSAKDGQGLTPDDSAAEMKSGGAAFHLTVDAVTVDESGQCLAGIVLVESEGEVADKDEMQRQLSDAQVSYTPDLISQQQAPRRTVSD